MAIKIKGATVIDDSKNVISGDGITNTGIAIYHGAGTGDYGRIRFYQDSSNNSTIHIFSTAWQSGTLSSHSTGAINLEGANGVTIGQWNAINSSGHWFDRSGNGQSSASFRSPIFYDSNNTGYYWDGASTSKWNESNQNGWHTFNNYGLGITGTYDSYRLQTVFAMGPSYRMAADGSATNNMYGIAWSHPNAGSLGGASNLNDHGILIINNGGFRAALSSRAVFSADVRGTLFYDYNNTGYYCDPNGTSNFNNLTITGTLTGSVSGNADTVDGLHVHTGRNNEANKIVRTDGNGYIQAGWINTDSGDSGIANRLTRIYSSYDAYLRYSTLTDFKVHMGLSAKNNYSRRIDYTSDANYHVGSMGHGSIGANEVFHGGSGFFDIWSGANYPAGTSHIHGFNALHYTVNSYGSTGGSAYGIQVAGQYSQDGVIFTRGCNNGGFSAWRRIMTEDIWHNSKYFGSDGVMYATRFYDSNNSAYYCDPTSYSQLSSGEFNDYCRVQRLTFRGEGGNSGNGNHSYAIFQSGGDWAWPYPDLRIAFHTGIQLGANSSYQGIRFYTDYDCSSQVMSVNNGSDGLGGGNVYINNGLMVGGSIRSPIFYDSNDTYYYNDLNSSRRFAGRTYIHEWIEFVNYTGLYSPNNNAHFYPNTGSYGSWRVDGSRDGWRGINFENSVVLMMNDNESGHHKNGYGWQFRWSNGTLYCYKNTYGGGTEAVVLDSSNYSSYVPAASQYAKYLSGAPAYTNGSDGWWRSEGAAGWYNATYGGGIFMQDATWVRVYNGKAFYVQNEITATGNIIAYYSDERLKNKTGYVTNAIEKITSLTAFYYTNNELAQSFGYTDIKQQIGLSAQEVEKVLPEIVSLAPFDMAVSEVDSSKISKSGENYLTIDYSKLVPLLVEAIKEQQTIINNQNSRLAKLEEQLTQLLNKTII